MAIPADASSDDRAAQPLGTIVGVLATAVCYYLATRAAWLLTFPESKVSLLFPPHAVLVSILLLVPTRHWWAYTLAAACSHYFATQQAGWPPGYALQCEIFDAGKYLLTAAGTRAFIKSPIHRLQLREAIHFVLIAVVIVPFGTAFWGAAFTVSNGYGTHYWIEWRNLGISNGVTTIVLVPLILIGVHRIRTKSVVISARRIAEVCLLGAGLFAVGYLAFFKSLAGPSTSPALLYSPIPLLIWAAVRFGLGGISASMGIVAVMAIWSTMQGLGPFVSQTPTENALALQFFLLVATMPLMFLAVAIDDERRSIEALRVSDERMSLAAESAQIALWDWDIANDTVWITEEGRKFFGFAPGEMLRYESLVRLVHPDDRAAREAAIQRALATHGSYEAEYRMILADGTMRWISARGHVPSGGADPGPRVVGVSIDITRQKQANAEAQEQREKLAHLSRVATLSALSGSLGHELIQPLTSILNNAQAGQRHVSQDAPDSAELHEIFADIISADRRAAEIIESLRTMLRHGHVALHPVNVNESLEELLRLTRSDLITRGISIANLATGDIPLAMTDHVQLQQVLLNLIVNACDAMEPVPPGERQLTLTTGIAQHEVHIGVLDRGIGLPDDVETLFQPFHTTKSGGLGMGLSICRTLVTSHGGRLWAERRAGRGAAFYVALRLAKEDADLPRPSEVPPSFELARSSTRSSVFKT